MREKLRAFYYPEFWVEYITLVKSILLFDEIHFMDRPSFSFHFSPNSQGFVTVGSASPIRQHEQWFRSQGVALYVHPAPDGTTGNLLEAVRADISDKVFLRRFQEGLRSSDFFLNLYVPAGANFGNGETQQTIAEKLLNVDLDKLDSALEVYEDAKLRPFDFSTEGNCAKTLVSFAMTCSAKMNFALDLSSRQGFSPLADMAPFNELLKAKYCRAIQASSGTRETQVPATELALAIMDELVRPEILHGLKLETVFEIRNGSEKAREAFLEHLVVLQSKLQCIPDDGDYSQTIQKLVDTEIRPAAREFQNKLAAVTDKILGALAVGAATGLVSSSATIAQIFGGLSWPALLTMASGTGIYLAKQATDAVIETRKARRECAISYLLDIDKRN